MVSDQCTTGRVGISPLEVFTPDDVADIWQSWRTPMGSTLFLVKYASRRGEPLFKVILNGEEVVLDCLKPVSGPYYRWSDLCLLFGK